MYKSQFSKNGLTMIDKVGKEINNVSDTISQRYQEISVNTSYDFPELLIVTASVV